MIAVLLHLLFPPTGLQGRDLRMTEVLTSFAGDVDLVADWMYYREKREEGLGGAWETALLISCLAATFLWLVVITDGRILYYTPLRGCFRTISRGALLFIAVVLEDAPQMILTFMIEEMGDYGGFSNAAVLNSDE